MRIKLNAYGKINLFLNVIGKRENGFHEIESIMQGIDLFDEVEIVAEKKRIEKTEIRLRTNNPSLPTDSGNLAVRAAERILMGYEGDYNSFDIYIKKNLPVAAGLAGGTADGAAVLLGINRLMGYKYTLKELRKIGEGLGADFPFSISMNAYKNMDLIKGLRGLEESYLTAIAKGIGNKLNQIESIPSYIIMMNPNIFVSTKEVYEGLDRMETEMKYNLQELLGYLENKDYEKFFLNTKNIMEEFTLNEYKEAGEMKKWAENNLNAVKVLMSGSGPTIVAYYLNPNEAKEDFEKIKHIDNKYLTITGVK